MKNHLEYKGYLGSVEFNAEDNCLFGKIIGINDLVNYEAASVEELNNVFEESVEDYLLTCKEINKEPNKHYKGVFNVRTDENIHRNLAIIAEKKKIKLNQLINTALNYLIENEEKVLENSNLNT